MQQGRVSNELEVKVSASEIWEVYGSLQFGMIVHKLVPDVIQKVQVLQGDGGVDTILSVTFQPGLGIAYQKEKFTEVNDDKRIKVVEVIEGGYLDVGFCMYRIILEIIEKDVESSIIKSTIQYEVEDQNTANAYPVSTQVLVSMGEAVEKYLIDSRGMENV